MSNMYFEFHDTVKDHPKTRKCARDLGVPIVQMVGHLACLWSWSLRMAADGELSSFEVCDIEIGAEWEGEPGLFVSTLEKHRYLDCMDGSYFLHDWADYAEHLKARERKRRERERKKSQMSRDVTGSHSMSRDSAGIPGVSRRTNEQKEQKEQINKSELENVRPVFDFWVKTFSKGKGPAPKLDDKRRGKIRARLKEGFSIADLQAAILGASKSDYHVTNNYTGLVTILKSAETVEGHIARLSGAEMNSPEPVFTEPGFDGAI